MRIGIVSMPRQLPAGGASMIDHVTDIARRVEELGLHGLWVTDAFARGWPTLDPLVLLGALCAATRRIELGTCVVQIPIRHPGGTRASRADGEPAVERPAALRRRHRLDPRAISRPCRRITTPASKCCPACWRSCAAPGRASRSMARHCRNWPGTEGGPPVMLGAWRSPRWIDLAAQHCQGWIASGIHGSFGGCRR